MKRCFVAIVEGVDPLLCPDGVRLHFVASARPVEGQIVRRAVGIEAEGRYRVLRRRYEPLPLVILEGCRRRRPTGLGCRCRGSGRRAYFDLLHHFHHDHLLHLSDHLFLDHHLNRNLHHLHNLPLDHHLYRHFLYYLFLHHHRLARHLYLPYHLFLYYYRLPRHLYLFDHFPLDHHLHGHFLNHFPAAAGRQRHNQRHHRRNGSIYSQSSYHLYSLLVWRIRHCCRLAGLLSAGGSGCRTFSMRGEPVHSERQLRYTWGVFRIRDVTLGHFRRAAD